MLLLVSCAGPRRVAEPSAPDHVKRAGGWARIELKDSRLEWKGRVDRMRPVLAWSGSGVVFRFRGTALKMGLNSLGGGVMDPSGVNYYNLIVDGKEQRSYPISTTDRELEISGLLDSVHEVRIEKATEALCGRDEVTYLDVLGELEACPSRARQLMVFGNSITAGYGIEDNEPTNSFQAQTENASVTYAAVAASLLGADVTRICVSGRGLIRNYDGSKEMLLPDFLEWKAPQERVAWTAESADIVVVEVGTNDFALGDPGELPFVLAYQELVGRLLVRYPNARIILLDSPMLTDEWPVDPKTRRPVPSASLLQGYLAQVKGGLPSAQRSRVSVLQLAQQGADVFGYGADYHPNRAQARCNGEELAAHIRQVAGW